ncbi:MAG TPA: AraC family transcriptional regulator, partial [Ramlibacter sp.]|nr:AraC family transcriptional regulator [Ramlibacter sp.]
YPQAESLIICHTVLEGRCWIQPAGGEPVALNAGDAVTLPHGDAHIIGSGLQYAPVNISDIVEVKAPELKPMRYGGSGAAALIVCGWLAFDRDVPNPLMSVLPRVFRAAVGKRPAGPWLEQSLRYAIMEAASGQPGSSAVATRVAESLFVEMLRAYVDSLPPAEPGWLAGLRDPHVGKCLELMHAQPGHDWSVDSLADEVHVSRSVLAQRFNDFVGVPPMQYLKRWRLAIAARMLRSERANIGRVIETVGYESEAAFSRAFKKEYGLAPGQWRSGGPREPVSAV